MKRRRLETVLAERLREVSKDEEIALSHWADRAGVARSYFWLLLDAKSSATLETVQRLADVVKIDPIDLLTERIYAVGVVDNGPLPQVAMANPVHRKRDGAPRKRR